jgi:hypothetical protein
MSWAIESKAAAFTYVPSKAVAPWTQTKNPKRNRGESCLLKKFKRAKLSNPALLSMVVSFGVTDFLDNCSNFYLACAQKYCWQAIVLRTTVHPEHPEYSQGDPRTLKPLPGFRVFHNPAFFQGFPEMNMTFMVKILNYRCPCGLYSVTRRFCKKCYPEQNAKRQAAIEAKKKCIVCHEFYGTAANGNKCSGC